MDQMIEKGKVLIERGEFQNAQRYFTSLLEQAEETHAARLWLARLNFMEGYPESALQQIQAAEALKPHDNETKALKGLYYLQSGKYREALELLESVAGSEPGLAFNYINLSNVYLELDRISEAMEMGRKAVQLNPTDPAAHFALSQALAVDGKLEDAIYEALETLKLNPMHLMAYVFLGSLYRQAGLTDTVIELYQECLRHVPGADPIREELVELLFAKNESAAARDHVAILAQKRGLPKDFFYLGQCTERLNQDDLAEKAFHQTAALDPRNWRPYFMLGNLYAKHGMGEESVSAYTAALERDPGNAELMNTLGLTLVRTGQPAQGEPYLRKAISLMPDRFEPVLNLAIAHASQKRWKEAKDYANAALKGAASGSVLHEEAKRLLAAIDEEERRTTN
jgi:tetratricopeptide (TPR) repeat protein